MPAERFVLDASVAVEWFLPGSGLRARYAEKSWNESALVN
jgi:hypothetical protein